MWGALLYGGRLVVVPYAVSRAPDDFLRAARRERRDRAEPDAVGLPPARCAPADGARTPRRPALALRWSSSAARRSTSRACAPWFDAPRRRAPAAGQHVRHHRDDRARHLPSDHGADAADARGRSPIGGRIPDLRVYVLDAHGCSRSPSASPARSTSAGAGVARGYLGRPELTAERFVPDPSRRCPASALYRTGDLARWRARRRRSSSSAASTTRSRSAASASSSARSRRRWRAIRRCARRRSSVREERRASGGWSPTWCRPHGEIRGRRAAPRSSQDRPAGLHGAGRLRRPAGACRSPPTASSTARALPAPGLRGRRGTRPFGAADAGWSGHRRDLGRGPRPASGSASTTTSSTSAATRSAPSRWAPGPRQSGLVVTPREVFRFPTVRGPRPAPCARLPESGAGRRPRGARRHTWPPTSLSPGGPPARLSGGARGRLPAGCAPWPGWSSDSEPRPGAHLTYNVDQLPPRRSPYDAARLREASTARGGPPSRCCAARFALEGLGEPLQLVARRGSRCSLEVEDLRHSGPRRSGRRAFGALVRRPSSADKLDWRRRRCCASASTGASDDSLPAAPSSSRLLDGWSLGFFLAELCHSLPGAAAGRDRPRRRGAAAPDDRPRPRPSATCVALEREALASAACRLYWERRLDGGARRTPRRRAPPPAARAGSGPAPGGRLDTRCRTEALGRPAGAVARAALASAQERPPRCAPQGPLLPHGGQRRGLRRVAIRPPRRRRRRAGDRRASSTPCPSGSASAPGSWLDLARQVFDGRARAAAVPALPPRRAAAGAWPGAGRPLFETLFNFIHFHVWRPAGALRRGDGARRRRTERDALPP